MSNRLDSLWTTIEALGTLTNLEFARRSDRGISPEHVALGGAVGFAYYVVRDAFVGTFRERPLRYLVFVTVWTAIASVLFTSDEDTDWSTCAGVGIGSLAYRVADRSRNA